MGKYNEAIKSFDKAIEIDPQFADAWYGKGITHEQLGRYSDAISIYEKLILIRPNDPNNWNQKGWSLTHYFDRHKEALEAIEKCLNVDSKHVEGLHTKGVILYNLKEYPKAIEVFDAVIKLDTTFPDGYYDRAKAKSKLGLNYFDDLDKAIEYGGKEFEDKAKNDGLT